MITNLELRRKLGEALSSRGCMVTISWRDGDGKNLNHYTLTQRFPREDIIPSLEHIAGQMEAEIDFDAENHP